MSGGEMHPNLARAIDALADVGEAQAVQAQSTSASAAPTATAEADGSSSSAEPLPHQYRAQQYALAEPPAGSNAAEIPLSVGVALPFCAQLLPTLHDATAAYFDFVTLPLGRAPATPGGEHELALTAPDTLMCASSWAHRVVGCLSSNLRLDAPNPSDPRPSHVQRVESEEEFSRQVSWAAHLGLPAIMVNLQPGRRHNANLARRVSQALAQTQSMHVWVRVPLCAPASADSEEESESSGASTSADLAAFDARDPWSAWNNLRALCDNHRRLGVALELGADLPPPSPDIDAIDLTQPVEDPWASPEQWIMDRWLGEPLRAVILSTAVFVRNKKGYPVLSRAHQALVRRLFEARVQWILCDESQQTQHPVDVSSSSDTTSDASASSLPRDLQSYQYYLRHLYAQHSSATHTASYHFELPYRDLLQAPLQPLQDNLESNVYEVFEKDPVKYRLYEDAVCTALSERHARPQAQSSDESPPPPAQVLVVGAGRGPLVRCVLRASERASVPVRVYALEKNPHACLTLRSLQQTDPLFRHVQLVHADMREWEGPSGNRAFADILVSELLGSFGDNELSPECLDGALRFLRSDGGISIPAESASFLVPVTSAKLWGEVEALGTLAATETPYVVRAHNYARLSPRMQPVFKFKHVAGGGLQTELTEGGWTELEHPTAVQAEKERVANAMQHATTLPVSHARADAALIPLSSPLASSPLTRNSRHATLTFPIPLGGCVHGLMGFFTSRLYGSIELSIVPGARHSTDMFSWFPIFFPLRTPLTMQSGSTLSVDMWRSTAARKVWYEWAVSAPVPSTIHNPNGRSYYIGL